MRFSRTNMRLAAARCRSLSRKIGVQTAEFSITAFCWRNADSRKSRTYERHNAEIRLELFNLSDAKDHARPRKYLEQNTFPNRGVQVELETRQAVAAGGARTPAGLVGGCGG